MNSVQLQQLEALCTKLYVFQDPNERVQAEKALTPFGTQPEYLPQAKFLLDNAQSAYAQHFATSSITKILTKYWNNFAATLRLEIRNHMLTYLATSAPKLQGFVVTQIIQLICRITKLGWFDEGQQDILEETTKFLKHSSQYYLIGLRILNQLLNEMNEVTTLAGQSWSEHRKTCNSFRDKIMLQIFKLSLTSLVELYNNPSSEDQLRDQALELAFRCLNFDFLGTSPDDSTDDLGSVQENLTKTTIMLLGFWTERKIVSDVYVRAPSSWKPLFEDDTTVKLFLQIYLNSTPPRSTQAMQGNFAASKRHFIHLLYCNRIGLSEQANHHEFCRFLARLKGNFQASSIVASKNYSEWIQAVAMFTMNSFNHWQWSPNSVFFLLTFWSRLVMSIYYIKNKDASMIETLAPQIVQAFLTARLEAIQAGAQSGDDEGIDEDEEQLLDQLEAIPHLGRCKYEIARNYIVALFDPLAQNFRKFAEMPPQSINWKELAILQGKLALLVYTMGGIIGGRQNIVHTTEEHDQIDAELTSRILELMRLHDGRLAVTRESPGKVKLELAFAEFLEFFRKAYLSDQASNSSKLYPRLQELTGITDSKMLLNIFVTKIATNLKFWVKNEKVIYKTLFELNELAGGYSSSKTLMKLDITGQLLTYHTSNYFPFLDYEGNVKYRTIYYLALARLLFLEDNFSKFDTFMEPLKQTFTALRDQTPPEVYRTDNCRKVLRGIFRDILGIIYACASRRSYLLLFDFLYPDFTSVFFRCADLLYDCSEVMNPMLKFFSEFVYSKGTRITFDTSSVNGILLFREASKMLSTYGARIINFNPSSEMYNEKYKGIMHCMTMFHRALTGSYVNFGIFALYGDTAFSDALSASLKMSLSIPMQDMLSFPKLTKVFFALFETLTDKHMPAVARLDSQAFRQLIIAVKEGVDAYEVSTSSQSCAIIERIVSFRFTTGKGVDQTAITMITQHLNENADVFNNLLTLLFQRALDNCQNLWSVSRPTMCLIMLSPDHFMNLKNQLLARQPPDRQQQLARDFDELMKDIRNNLESSNRDKFSQNFNAFVSDVKKYVVL